MRVCDKHPDRRARDVLILSDDDARFDLCDECKSDVLRLLTEPAEPAPRRGRPPKSADAENAAP